VAGLGTAAARRCHRHATSYPLSNERSPLSRPLASVTPEVDDGVGRRAVVERGPRCACGGG
jgi:hypothetical protein